MKRLLRGSIAMFFGSVALFAASTAFADGEACYVDRDCPGTACGDSVCNWNKSAPVPNGSKLFYCNPAGTDPVGLDGWCTTDADCKCMGQGAKCAAPYCTFTKAPAGSGGASGTAGAASSSAGAPTGAAGAATASAGAPAASGGAASSSAGASTTSDTSKDSSGCSISLPGKTNRGPAAALALLGLGLVLARRRR